MRATRSYLVRKRIAILRRSALHHVRDIHVGTGQLDPAKQLGEELARLPDEGLTQTVLMESGSLSYEHELCFGIAYAEYHLGTAPAQSTQLAVAQRLPQRSQSPGGVPGPVCDLLSAHDDQGSR